MTKLGPGQLVCSQCLGKGRDKVGRRAIVCYRCNGKGKVMSETYRRGDIVRVWDRDLSKSVWGVVLAVRPKTVSVTCSFGEISKPFSQVRLPNADDGSPPSAVLDRQRRVQKGVL